MDMVVHTHVASYGPDICQNGYYGLKLILIFLKITTSQSTVHSPLFVCLSIGQRKKEKDKKKKKKEEEKLSKSSVS